MSAAKCPNCKRETYSQKWGTCTACGYRHLGETVTETVTRKGRTVTTLTNADYVATIITDVGYREWPKGGRGKRVYASNAERQRAYRERSKAT